MEPRARVLIADDEAPCRLIVARILKQAGYNCACAENAPGTLALLERDAFDLLITDLRMPGNSGLELVGQVEELADGVPVIVMTGFPSVETAIEAVHLPVVAYLVKPVARGDLLQNVEKAMAWGRLRRAAAEAARRTERCRSQLAELTRVLKSAHNAHALALDAFATLTVQNALDSLMDLRHLLKACYSDNLQPQPCHLFECPGLTTLAGAVAKAVKVLDKTRHAFKSKDLGVLRRELDELLLNFRAGPSAIRWARDGAAQGNRRAKLRARIDDNH